MISNPVSKLQELMHSLGKDLPVYTFTDCLPDGTVPIFQCNATANGQSASARGSNKKDAKRATAEKLLCVIQATLPKITLPIVSIPDVDPTSLTRRIIPDDELPLLIKRRIPGVDPASLTRRAIPYVDPAPLTTKTIFDVDPASLTRRTTPDVDPASLTRRTTPDVDPASLTRRTTPDVDPASLTRTTTPDVDLAPLRRTSLDVDPAPLTSTSSPPPKTMTLQGNNSTPKTMEAKDPIGGNFIGKLQTFCQRYQVNLAKYHVTQCMNILPLCFEATCTLGNFSGTGRGSSKQIAKQIAARELIFQLEWSKFWAHKFTKSTPIIAKSIPESVPKTESRESIRKITQLEGELSKSCSSSSSIDFTINDTMQSRDESTDSMTSSNDPFDAAERIEKLQICQTDYLSSSLNHGEDSGVSVTSDRADSKSCYLCANSFHQDCRPAVSELSASDVREQLLQKKLPISEAIQMFQDCDDQFFDSIDSMVDFLDLVISELNCVYSLSFTKTKHMNESVCTLMINDLKNTRFLGIAATAHDAFKNAAVNGLRSLSFMMKRHKYHGFRTNGSDTESS